MKIRAGFQIAYECEASSPIILMLSIRPEREANLLTPEVLSADSGAPMQTYLDLYGNVCTRALMPPGRTTFSADFLIQDTGEPDRASPGATQHSIQDLPNATLLYLLPSRYCETEGLSDLAWSLFGQTPPGWPRVEAIVNYVHRRISFGYPNARSTRTAAEAHQEQVGVCRDFAHLAVALCRCMNIPARYCTGYLGDIGVPPVAHPMDFSAWFEVYLGGGWHVFDARHNRPRIGRILMAYGRDAADVAITTSFGSARLDKFDVVTEEVA